MTSQQPSLNKQKAREKLWIDWESIFLTLTIGLPFCTFKILCGIVAEREGFPLIGNVFIAWGTVDLLLNLARTLRALLKKTPVSEYCVLATIGKLFNHAPLMLAIDTFLSFSIICLVLWSGWITKLDPIETKLWYVATTVNLLSVAIIQIWCAYHIKTKATRKSRDDRRN